jgi:hypothetical protein
LPTRFVEKPMKSVVWLWEKSRRKRHNSRDCVPGGTQNPPVDKSREDFCGWSGKNWKKVLNYIRPCRNNCVHIDLPVLVFYPIKTSAGRYVFVYKPLKLLA